MRWPLQLLTVDENLAVQDRDTLAGKADHALGDRGAVVIVVVVDLPATWLTKPGRHALHQYAIAVFLGGALQGRGHGRGHHHDEIEAACEHEEGGSDDGEQMLSPTKTALQLRLHCHRMSAGNLATASHAE